MKTLMFCGLRHSIRTAIATIGIGISIAWLSASCSTGMQQPDVSTVDQQPGTDVQVGSDIVAMDVSRDVRADAGVDSMSLPDATLDTDASNPAFDALDVSVDVPTTSDADASMPASDASPDVAASDGGDGMAPCSFPFQVCPDGTCADPANDPNNCGGCGNVCPMGQVCEFAQCFPNGCDTDYFRNCNGRCVPYQTDPSNCGSCGHVCPAGVGCMNGQCAGPNTCIQCEMNNLGPAPTCLSTGFLTGLCTYDAVRLLVLPDGGYGAFAWTPDAGNAGWGCDGFTGADRDNCNALLACIRTSHCMGVHADPTACLCGTLDACTCFTSGIGAPQLLNGPCAQEYLAGATSENVGYAWTDPTTPVGVANALAMCDVNATCSCP